MSTKFSTRSLGDDRSAEAASAWRSPIRSALNNKISRNSFIVSLRRLVSAENLHENKSLGEYTSTGLGGVADQVVIVHDGEQLLSVIKLAVSYAQPYAILGGGTGTLISEVGFPGTVIINQAQGFSFDYQTSQVVCDSGLSNDRLVNSCASQGWGGLEFLAAIPGTIGGAVVSGASWQGKNLRPFVKEMRVFVPSAKVDEGGEIVSVVNNQLPKVSDQPILFPLLPPGGQMPVILTIRLQMAKLNEEEVRRRLLNFRQQRSHQQTLLLSNIFVPALVDTKIPSAEIRKLRMPEGVNFDRRNLELLQFRGSTTVNGIRQAINQIIELAKYYGTSLETRLTFLGYWPDKEGDADPSDA